MKTAHSKEDLDRAIREAGFAVEPLQRLVESAAEILRDVADNPTFMPVQVAADIDEWLREYDASDEEEEA